MSYMLIIFCLWEKMGPMKTFDVFQCQRFQPFVGALHFDSCWLVTIWDHFEAQIPHEKIVWLPYYVENN